MPDIELETAAVPTTPTNSTDEVLAFRAGALIKTNVADLNNNSFYVDATVAGEPIVYDQAGARLNGLTSTTHVNLTQGDNRIYFRDSDGSTVQYFVNGMETGALTFWRGNYVQNVMTLAANGEVQMQNATAVKVPAATAATHAAQVSAIDATTGQLAIGGIEMGDTGWRDISGDISASWTLAGNGIMRVRRVGNAVTFYTDYLVGTSSTSSALYVMPSGFQPGNTIYPVASVDPYGTNVTRAMLLSAAGGLVRLGDASLWPRVQLNFTYLTTDAWPATLPGTAA